MSTPWLVSKRFDLWMFLVPAVVALALVPLGPVVSPSGETPFPMWVAAILLIDVAHVWSTLYRTYLDRRELTRRPTLYIATPVVAYLFGAWLAGISFAAFWTGLAYVAVFHFVRQQYGWVALYNRRDPDTTVTDRRIDTVAIYAATVFPLLWWHANLPRQFEWFLAGDFAAWLVPPELVSLLWPVYVLALVAFAGRQVQRWWTERRVATGKIIVVVTTALCWGVGIIATNSDWAFTVTNVIIHGVPYLGIVWVYGRRTEHRPGTVLFRVFRRTGGVLLFYGLVVMLAYAEELAWDRLLWHTEAPLFFGPIVHLTEAAVVWVMPLLALPQLVHYLLDGFIWRTSPRRNPGIARLVPVVPRTT